MCYAKPGFRCSANARARLDETARAAVRSPNSEAAALSLETAKEEFFRTPEGIEALRRGGSITMGSTRYQMTWTIQPDPERADAIEKERRIALAHLRGEDLSEEDAALRVAAKQAREERQAAARQARRVPTRHANERAQMCAAEKKQVEAHAKEAGLSVSAYLNSRIDEVATEGFSRYSEVARSDLGILEHYGERRSTEAKGALRNRNRLLDNGSTHTGGRPRSTSAGSRTEAALAVRLDRQRAELVAGWAKALNISRSDVLRRIALKQPLYALENHMSASRLSKHAQGVLALAA